MPRLVRMFGIFEIATNELVLPHAFNSREAADAAIEELRGILPQEYRDRLHELEVREIDGIAVSIDEILGMSDN